MNKNDTLVMDNCNDFNQDQDNKIVSEEVSLENTSSVSHDKGSNASNSKGNNSHPYLWSALIILGIALAGLVFLCWLTSKRENNNSQVAQVAPNKEVQEYVRNLDDAFRSNKNLTKEEMKGSFVPISAKLEASNDGDYYIVLGTIDCFDGDASFLSWSKSDATFNDMKAAHKKDWSGRIEGSEGMMYTAFEGGCGFALRLYNYERTDSCTFYYGKDEVAEMYRAAKEYVENGGDLMIKNVNEERYDIGNYTIEIPETMYLSGDQSFDIVYNFWTKDESEYARIQVKIEDVENASKIAELFNEGWDYTKEEAEEFRRDIIRQCNEAGMNVSNMDGPDFVVIDGDRVFHSAMIRNTPVPTRVDDYQLYSKNKKYIITTSYRVKDRNEWEGVLRRSILSIRKK